MTKIINLAKKYLGEILITLGSGILAYNIFNFSHRGSGLRVSNPYYYYHSDTLLFITIGTILIVVGILIIKNKRHD